MNLDLNEIIELRHTLHQRAEVSNEEKETAATIASWLEKYAPDRLMTDIGGRGIAARYTGRGDGPHVLIRCELDGLPIPETGEMEYFSRNEGASHKCGHDGHMAILAGLEQSLTREPPGKGSVTLLFQPAEETGEGARRVVEDKTFAGLQPDYAFALHNLPGYEEGEIVVSEGVFASASRGIIVRLQGDTSHAAEPQQGRSPAHLSRCLEIS